MRGGVNTTARLFWGDLVYNTNVAIGVPTWGLQQREFYTSEASIEPHLLKPPFKPVKKVHTFWVHGNMIGAQKPKSKSKMRLNSLALA